MKILILTLGYPSEKDLQLGSFMLDQAKALKKKGHEVGMLSIKFSNSLPNSSFFGLNQCIIDGISCYEFSGIPTRILRRFLGNKIINFFERLIIPKIFKKIKSNFGEPDLIHAHFLPNIFYGTIIKEKFKIPLIATEHWSKVSQTPVDKYIKQLCQITYPKVDKLISVSSSLKNKIKQYSDQESIVIHNLIDNENLKPALNKTDNKIYTIIAIGSLIKRKGFDILIKALSISYLKQKTIQLKIIGKGNEYDYLKKLINDNGLKEKVFLVGQKSKNEIYEELHRADLFVLSSRLENFSVSLIEATANGVPSIATLCGGVEEYPIEEVVKIPVNDITAMKHAMEISYENRNLINRETIQEKTLNYFSPDKIVDKLNPLYIDALNRKK